MNRVQGKVAIVTGGPLGIGRATSLLLAKEGAKVAVVDINDDEGHKVAEEINASGGTAKFWRLDTSSEQDVNRSGVGQGHMSASLMTLPMAFCTSHLRSPTLLLAVSW